MIFFNLLIMTYNLLNITFYSQQINYFFTVMGFLSIIFYDLIIDF